ncbi:MAG: TetR/AcrR family transcriptional regulator [Candidatus Sedimenticola sp. PURPLELP]
MARPIQFDRKDVLEKAMHAFWDQGYCATSMASLVEITHLKPGSIYAAFDSKEGLFLAALDHYGKRSAAKIGQSLASADTPLQGVRDHFRQMAESAADPMTKRSCLLVNTALELGRGNPAVLQRVNHHLGVIETLFLEALESAQATGELGEDKDPEALAAFLMASIWGLRVLGSTAPAPERTKSVVDQLLSLLD